MVVKTAVWSRCKQGCAVFAACTCAFVRELCCTAFLASGCRGLPGLASSAEQCFKLCGSRCTQPRVCQGACFPFKRALACCQLPCCCSCLSLTFVSG